MISKLMGRWFRREKKTAQVKRVKTQKPGQYISSIVVKDCMGSSKVKGGGFVVIHIRPLPVWMKEIHLLDCRLLIVYYRGDQPPCFLKVTNDKLDNAAIVRRACVLSEPKEGVFQAARIDGVHRVRNPWEAYARWICVYAKELERTGHILHPTIQSMVERRQRAIKAHGRTNFDIWQIVEEVERTGRSARFMPITTEKFEQFVCKDGVYRYYARTGRVQMRYGPDDWRFIRRPRHVPRFQKKRVFEVSDVK